MLSSLSTQRKLTRMPLEALNNPPEDSLTVQG